MEKLSMQLVMDEVMTNRLNNLFIFDNNFFDNLSSIKIAKIQDGRVCFTGNRPMSLPWKYNEDCELFKEFKSRLKQLIVLLIDSGYKTFITGMAMGFDIICAEIVLELKNIYDVKLNCAVPCLNQTKGWKQDYIERYQHILNSADSVYFTSNYAYFDGCYIIRNKYMVENSDLVLGCQLKKSKGTESTLKYAKEKNKNIILLN